MRIESLCAKDLGRLSRGARCGVRALKQVAGVTRDCTAETIAFKLDPAINAAGRLDDAMLGVRLLTTDNRAEAQQLADQLEQLNRERQRIEAGYHGGGGGLFAGG